MTVLPPRSYLYVPGNAGEKLGKATDRGAEALILDLEDAVPLREKDAARAAVVAWLGDRPVGDGVELWVRVNAGALGEDDIRALAGLPALTGLALAKADPEWVRAAAELLTSLGDQDTVLMPMVESASAVLRATEIAGAPRAHQIQIGEVDLTGELGIVPGPDESELIGVRTSVVLASRAAGIHPPVGPVSRITADPAALRASTERLARLGFLGRVCIHPAQIDVVHQVFTPTPEQVEEAEDVIRLLEQAEAGGSGVVLDDRGRLVDLAVLASARRTLALAARAAGR
jgi:citrate lyase subunit beta/citryl-CoA lyase